MPAPADLRCRSAKRPGAVRGAPSGARRQARANGPTLTAGPAAQPHASGLRPPQAMSVRLRREAQTVWLRRCCAGRALRRAGRHRWWVPRSVRSPSVPESSWDASYLEHGGSRGGAVCWCLGRRGDPPRRSIAEAAASTVAVRSLSRGRPCAESRTSRSARRAAVRGVPGRARGGARSGWVARFERLGTVPCGERVVGLRGSCVVPVAKLFLDSLRRCSRHRRRRRPARNGRWR